MIRGYRFLWPPSKPAGRACFACVRQLAEHFGMLGVLPTWSRTLIHHPHVHYRRFLQHVLPSGYTRVRRFGWLHPAARVRLNRVRALLHQAPGLTPCEQQTWQPPGGDPEPAHELEAPAPRPATGAPLCPHCQQPMRLMARWRRGQTLPALARPPP